MARVVHDWFSVACSNFISSRTYGSTLGLWKDKPPDDGIQVTMFSENPLKVHMVEMVLPRMSQHKLIQVTMCQFNMKLFDIHRRALAQLVSR
ncbi:hypothetical protein L1049_016368 [Liquidambar formosana]|uniref:Uncharacterized protein n=1 Tax=Liquidambar formosana TaxID=63359 RepID=A0AAP0S183_LIQFO